MDQSIEKGGTLFQVNFDTFNPVSSGVYEFLWQYKKFSVSLLLFTALYAGFLAITTFGRTARLLKGFPTATGISHLLNCLPYLKKGYEGVPLVLAAGLEKFGRTFVVWVGTMPYLIVGEGGAVTQTIFSAAKYIDKGQIAEAAFHKLVGEGLISAKPDNWKKDRKLLTPFFKIQNFDRFLYYFNKHTKTLVTVLDKVAAEDKPVDLRPILFRATLDFLSEAVMGKELCLLKGKNEQFLKAFRLGFSSIKTKLFKPWLSFPLIWDVFGDGKGEKFCDNMIQGYIKDELIVKRRAYVNSPEYKETLYKTDTEPPMYDALFDTRTDKEIAHQLVTFAGAGYETTGTSMNYTLFLLSLHPEWQRKVQEEIDPIFDSLDSNDDNLTMTHLGEMKILEMCIKESLRMFPAAPIIPRQAPEDIVLEDGRIIPKGVNIVFLLREVHRDPNTFPEPNKFNPERFLPENCASRNLYSYIPFSAGPRNCLGMRYAMTQMKVCLSRILRKFSVSTTSALGDILLTYAVVLEHSPPIKICLKPRTFN